jgi:peptide/nickel transport system ATP-binding protein
MSQQNNVIAFEPRPRAKSPEPLLSVRGLTIAAADGRELVRDVSFDLPQRGSLGIVGESGSGKSLTCRAIAGALPPGLKIVSGTMRFRGSDLAALQPRQWQPLRGVELGVVFQDPGSYLNPSIAIGAQLVEALRAVLPLSRLDARAGAMRLLARVGFTEPAVVFGQYPFELSGGMVQRALIAVAVCADPSLLIADEATTALDVTVQAEVLNLIADLRRERQVGLLMVSHDLAVVSQVCDQVVVMRDGAVVESGPTTEALRRPRHDYTRRLIDTHDLYGLGSPAAAQPTMVAAQPDTARAAQPGAAPLLSISDLHVGYGPRPILRGIDLEVRRGEIVGLIGETGSGKTTLLRAVLGVGRPTRGSIVLDGEPIAGAKARQLRDLRRTNRLQYVFQDPLRSLDPDLTIAESVGEGLDIQGGIHPRERLLRVATALEAVGLDPALARRRPAVLSGGQRQRAVIARALVLDPLLLLLDEPVSALDAVHRAQVLRLLKRLAEERGLAQVFISHDLGSVAGIADRIAVLHRGTIVETGPAAQLLTSPRHPYTRALIEAAPRLALADGEAPRAAARAHTPDQRAPATEVLTA